MRTLWVGVVLVLGACGGTQSPSSTTVSSAGADVAVGETADSAAAPDAEPSDARPPVEAYAREPEAIPEPPIAETAEEPSRRDTKLMSYEEAMALPIEIGDVTSKGGEAQLSADQVASFMDEHLEEMYEQCIRRELERGNILDTVTIDLAIRGKDGMILGTTIEPGRRRFKKCLEGYLEDLRFPTFASPRMGARYRFHTG